MGHRLLYCSKKPRTARLYLAVVSRNSCPPATYSCLFTLIIIVLYSSYTNPAEYYYSSIYFDYYTRTASSSSISGSTCQMFTYHSTHASRIYICNANTRIDWSTPTCCANAVVSWLHVHGEHTQRIHAYIMTKHA